MGVPSVLALSILRFQQSEHIDTFKENFLSCRYAYLIDGKGRVRWRGSGQATVVEADALVRCSRKLLHRDE